MENQNSNLGLNLPPNPTGVQNTPFNQFSPYLPPAKTNQVTEVTFWDQFLEFVNSKKVLEIAIWLVLLTLLVPSGMAMASWNAVPGDFTYSWKISLEKGLLVVLRPSKTLQTSTQLVLTQRRFSEATKMLDGDQADVGLKNLTAQVQTASESIQSLSAGSSKTEFKTQYIAALTELNQKLEQEKKFHQGSSRVSNRNNKTISGSTANPARPANNTQGSGGTTIVQNTFVQNTIIQNVQAPAATNTNPVAENNSVANEISQTQEQIQQTIEQLQTEPPSEPMAPSSDPTEIPPSPVPVEPTSPPVDQNAGFQSQPNQDNNPPHIQGNDHSQSNDSPNKGNDNSNKNENSNSGGE